MKRFENIKNWHLKFLAVVTAMLLWLFVAGTENYVYNLNEPVSVLPENLATDLVMSSTLPTVNVKYRSLDGQMKNVTAADFNAVIDLKDLREGDHLAKVLVSTTNPQIRVIASDPSDLRVTLEAVTTKQIDTKLTVNGQPAPGYLVAKSSLSDAKIKIKGPQSILAPITEINFSLNLDGTETADFSRLISVMPDPSWNVSPEMVSFDPDKVEASLQIRKANGGDSGTSATTDQTGTGPSGTDLNAVKKTIMVPITLSDPASLVKELLPANLLVTFQGDQATIDSLKPEMFSAVVDLNRLEKGGVFTVQNADIKFDSSLKVTVVDFSPAKITVKF